MYNKSQVSNGGFSPVSQLNGLWVNVAERSSFLTRTAATLLLVFSMVCPIKLNGGVKNKKVYSIIHYQNL